MTDPAALAARRSAVRGCSGITGAIVFFDAFFAAPSDADIEIRLGSPEEPGETFVIASIGSVVLGLTPREARLLADIAEDAMRKFPRERDAAALPNLIMGLRLGADKADEGTLRAEGER